MKKKLSVLLAFVLFVSACGIPLNQTAAVKLIKTTNGSVIFNNEEAIKKLCKKTDLDAFTEANKIDAIKDEFTITNNNDLLYAKNKDKFVSAGVTPSDCQYQPFYFDFMRDANNVQIGEVDINKDDVINIEKLLKDKSVSEFTKSKPLSVVGIVSKTILENKDSDSYLQSDLSVEKTGRYKLIAKPVYRIYHFADKKMIYDFDLSGIRGLSFELELIK